MGKKNYIYKQKCITNYYDIIILRVYYKISKINRMFHYNVISDYECFFFFFYLFNSYF